MAFELNSHDNYNKLYTTDVFINALERSLDAGPILIRGDQFNKNIGIVRSYGIEGNIVKFLVSTIPEFGWLFENVKLMPCSDGIVDTDGTISDYNIIEFNIISGDSNGH